MAIPLGEARRPTGIEAVGRPLQAGERRSRRGRGEVEEGEGACERTRSRTAPTRKALPPGTSGSTSCTSSAASSAASRTSHHHPLLPACAPGTSRLPHIPQCPLTFPNLSVFLKFTSAQGVITAPCSWFALHLGRMLADSRLS